MRRDKFYQYNKHAPKMKPAFSISQFEHVPSKQANLLHKSHPRRSVSSTLVSVFIMYLKFILHMLLGPSFVLSILVFQQGLGSRSTLDKRGSLENGDHMRRQANGFVPTFTADAYCYDSDSLFYLNPDGTTFQIQCDTPYTGTKISVVDSDSLTACIASCSETVCVGATFDNIGDDNIAGTCTTYSEITGRSTTQDTLGYSDSAILVIRADGATVATSGGRPTGALSNTLGMAASVSGTVSALLTSRSAVLETTSAMNSSSSVATITNGGVRPMTATGASMSVSILNTSTGYPLVPSGATDASVIGSLYTWLPASVQATYTAILPYTRYIVHTVEICTATPAICSIATKMGTEVLVKTVISCRPGICTGPATVAATDVCMMIS